MLFLFLPIESQAGKISGREKKDLFDIWEVMFVQL